MWAKLMMERLHPLYEKNVNTVIDYIQAHLDEKLNLDKLARIACFSPYHFHRIFKAVSGETLSSYIKRLRLEKALRLLRNHNNLNLTKMALELGFSSGANFSRDFSSYYGFPPREALQKDNWAKRPLQKVNLPQLSLEKIVFLPRKTIIYKRINQGYKPRLIQEAFRNISSFALSQRQISEENSQLIGIGYDDPDFTEAAKCRYDAALSVPADYKLPPRAEFNQKEIKGGHYAVFLHEGPGESFHTAWDAVFQNWLIRSHWLVEHKPHLEVYLPPSAKPGIFKAELCLPVRKI